MLVAAKKGRLPRRIGTSLESAGSAAEHPRAFGHWAGLALLNAIGGALLTNPDWLVGALAFGIGGTLGLWLILTLAIRMFLHMQYEAGGSTPGTGIAAVARSRAAAPAARASWESRMAGLDLGPPVGHDNDPRSPRQRAREMTP